MTFRNKCLTAITNVRIVYRADVNNNKTNEHKYYYGISDTPFKERYENHKMSFQHRSHLTTSDLSKYYWKLVDNGTEPTIQFQFLSVSKVTPLLISTTYI